ANARCSKYVNPEKGAPTRASIAISPVAMPIRKGHEPRSFSETVSAMRQRHACADGENQQRKAADEQDVQEVDAIAREDCNEPHRQNDTSEPCAGSASTA